MLKLCSMITLILISSTFAVVPMASGTTSDSTSFSNFQSRISAVEPEMRSVGGDPAISAIVGEPIIISTKIENENIRQYSRLGVIVETRDSEGITTSLQILRHLLQISETRTVNTMWRPADHGTYDIRLFVIEMSDDFSIPHSPQILSLVKESQIEVMEGGKILGCTDQSCRDSLVTYADLQDEIVVLKTMNSDYANEAIYEGDYPRMLGTFSENGRVLVEDYFCSDLCPAFARVVIVYEDIRNTEECTGVKGISLIDIAWHGYFGCAPLKCEDIEPEPDMSEVNPEIVRMYFSRIYNAVNTIPECHN